MASPATDRFWLVIERVYPYVGASAAAAGAWHLFDFLQHAQVQTAVDLKQVAGIIFNVAVTLTGVLFTLYVLAVAPTGGLLERIVGTRTFAGFRNYVIQALVLGMVLIFTSTPFQAVKDATWGAGVWSRPGFVAFTFLTVAVFLTFFRVGHIFVILSRMAISRSSH